MIIMLDRSDFSRYDLKSNTIWETLYDFLNTRVNYWGHTSDVFAWCGQEEDIVADIVQEAIMRTFIYTRKYFLWSKEEVAPIASLNRLAIEIAYKAFREMTHQDSQFVYTRLHRGSSQGYTIITMG